MTHAALAAEASTVPDERFLIARAQQGDRDAARSLYDAHSRRVHRLVFRLCGGDEEMARDFTQDTFIRVFDKLSSFCSWLEPSRCRPAGRARRLVNGVTRAGNGRRSG